MLQHVVASLNKIMQIANEQVTILAHKDALNEYNLHVPWKFNLYRIIDCYKTL